MLDRIGWDEATWVEIREAVDREIGALAVCRRLMPARSVSSEATIFSSGAWTPGSGRVGQETTLPVIEVHADMRLTDQQVRAETLNGDALSMAKGYAHLLAQVEDLAVLGAADLRDIERWKKAGVQVPTISARNRGLYNLVDGQSRIDVYLSGPRGNQRSLYGTNSVDAVEKAIDKLVDRNFFGPFALLVRPELYAELNTRISPSRIVPFNILPHDLAPIESSRALNRETGLVVALGGNPMYLARPRDSYSLEFLNVDGEGLFNFRLFNRFAFRATRPDSVIQLDFKNTQAPPPKGASKSSASKSSASKGPKKPRK